MARYKLRLLLLPLITFIIFTANASKFNFSKLSVENGLSNNEVNVIFKDSHGFVWFGTLRGLDRFDGVEIRSFADKFPEQVENILSIEEDSKSNLWIGTSEGLFQYNPNNDRFTKIALSEPASIGVIRSVNENQLFLGTNNGLVIYNSETGESEQIIPNQEPDSEQNYITDILVDSHGSCWLATRKGLVKVSLDDKEINNYYFESEQQTDYNSFTSLCTIGNKMYLGTSNTGIVEFNLNSKIFTKNNSIGNFIVTTIASNNQEKLYVGTNGSGLKIINLRTNEVETVEKDEDDPRSLSSNSIYSFLLDESQRFWIGTYSGGVNYSNSVSGGFQLHPVSTDYAAVNKSLRSFYFSADGNRFFGTRNGFIHLDVEDNIKVFRTDNSNGGLRSNIILTVYPFKDQILIGTYGGGISAYDPEKKMSALFLNEERFRTSNNYAFAKDIEDQLWIASFDGIYKYQQGTRKLRNYNTENSALSSNQIFYLTVDSKNRLWTGSNKGVSVFEITADSLKMIPLPAQLDLNYKVNYIDEDQAGNIWVCNEIGGLFKFNDDLDEFSVYTQKNGLPDNSTCAIIENSPGSFWISTLKGLCHFSLQNNQFKNYSISDGLPGLVFSPAAAYLTEDGKIWLGNEKGLVGFYPEDVDKKVIQSRIAITNLFIAGQNILPGEGSRLNKPIEFTEELVLNYKSNNIGFRFVDLNYLSSFDNNYFLLLEGHDNEWRNNGNSNTIYYENLKPGKYIFKVKNVVSASEEASNVYELKIVVKQAFTRSIFFWLGLFIIVLFIGFYFYRTYTRLRKIQKEYLKEHEEMRKYQSSGLSTQDLNTIVEKVKQYIKSEKPYLNSELKLSAVSKELNIPSHHISQALNQVLDQSFSDFINKYRVREVRYMLENEAHQKLTLMAIARQCGFNSKTSFYRVFKKFTGKTPADYLESIKS
jgi:ligand-binding sensor domain-containing protein/AraC-like DNA-binding protein